MYTLLTDILLEHRFKYSETGVNPMAGDIEAKEDDPQSHIYSHIEDCYPQIGNN